jgi:putative ABC transport system substrate-binding protein
LQELGWTDGRNVSIDTRWSAGNAADTRKFAAELVSLAPDLILASGGTVVGTLLQVTSTVPIVFTQTADPVGGGLVARLAQAPLGFSSACVTAEGSRLLTASAPFSSRSQMRRTTM